MRQVAGVSFTRSGLLAFSLLFGVGDVGLSQGDELWGGLRFQRRIHNAVTGRSVFRQVHIETLILLYAST